MSSLPLADPPQVQQVAIKTTVPPSHRRFAHGRPRLVTEKWGFSQSRLRKTLDSPGFTTICGSMAHPRGCVAIARVGKFNSGKRRLDMTRPPFSRLDFLRFLLSRSFYFMIMLLVVEAALSGLTTYLIIHAGRDVAEEEFLLT